MANKIHFTTINQEIIQEQNGSITLFEEYQVPKYIAKRAMSLIENDTPETSIVEASETTIGFCFNYNLPMSDDTNDMKGDLDGAWDMMTSALKIGRIINVDLNGFQEIVNFEDLML